MAKTAESAADKLKAEKPKLTAEQAIKEIRNLRAGGLFVGNMEYVDLLLAEFDRRGRENMCDACGGNGKPVSGLPCMCQGTGLMSRAAEYLRLELFHRDQECDRLKAENVELMKHEIANHEQRNAEITASIVQEGVPS